VLAIPLSVITVAGIILFGGSNLFGGFNSTTPTAQLFVREAVIVVISLILGVSYYILLMTRKGARNGQTVGKRALDIRVIRDDGQPVTTGTVLQRLLVISVLSLITVGILGVLDYLWPLGDRSNRALHDMIAKTHVVFAPDERGRRRRKTGNVIGLCFAPYIVGIVLAVALPSFLGQTSKAQTSALEQEIYTAYLDAKSASIDHTPQGEYDTGLTLVGDITSSDPELTGIINDAPVGEEGAGHITVAGTVGTTFSAQGITADGSEIVEYIDGTGFTVTANNP
jgi:uncharacterized RDD family membrane protein YckC/type II secretory pathway pseudopilin PulG